MQFELPDIIAMAKAGQFECALELAETIDDSVACLQALEAIKAAEQEAGKGEA